MLLRVLLCILVIAAIAAHKMSTINGNDFGLYMNRINGELVRYALWDGRAGGRKWKEKAGAVVRHNESNVDDHEANAAPVKRQMSRFQHSPTKLPTFLFFSAECQGSGILSGCSEFRAARGAGTAAVFMTAALAVFAIRALKMGYFDGVYVLGTAIFSVATIITCAVTLGTWDSYVSFALNVYFGHVSSSFHLYIVVLVLSVFGNVPTFCFCRTPQQDVDTEAAAAGEQTQATSGQATIGMSPDPPQVFSSQTPVQPFAPAHAGQSLSPDHPAAAPNPAMLYPPQAGGMHYSPASSPQLPRASGGSAMSDSGAAAAMQPSAPPAAAAATTFDGAPPAYDDIYPNAK